ncbi:transposase, partial [Escherichia coli]
MKTQPATGETYPKSDLFNKATTQEKIAIVQQSFEPGMTVSLVARQHGVAASQLFLWRKQYQE